MKYLSLDNIKLPEIFEQKHIPSLNGIRALAITLVIISHIRIGPGNPQFFTFFDTYIANGSVGVQIFFVLSGFLITGLLLKEKVLTNNISLRNFYARRLLRIFPVFYCFIIVIILLKVLGIITISKSAILVAGFYLANLIPTPDSFYVLHTWSLAVEEQFYLLWPLVIMFLPKKYVWIVSLIFLYNILIRPYLFFHPDHSPSFLLNGFLTFLPALLSGALLSISLFKGWLGKPKHLPVKIIGNLSLPLALLCFFPRRLGLFPLFSLPFDYLLSSIFITIFIYYEVHRSTNSLIYKILNSRLLTEIGILSYSIYIWQQLFCTTTANYMVNAWWARYPQNIGITLIVACISYYCIEKPILRLKTKFR